MTDEARIADLEAEVAVLTRERDEARSHVAIGATMLARQCDLARQAEMERDEARAMVSEQQAALDAYGARLARIERRLLRGTP
jgi:hypothetical protein